EQKLSPLVGLIYQPLSWLSLYGNYVSSLGTWGTSNVISLDINGHPLPAQQSHSYEGGIKIETLGGRLRSTLAAFDLTKTHVATRDFSSPDPTALRAIGEAHSTGVEFDISGALTSRLSLIGSYAYTDAKFSKDNSGLQDNLIANVPRHSGACGCGLRLSDENSQRERACLRAAKDKEITRTRSSYLGTRPSTHSRRTLSIWNVDE